MTTISKGHEMFGTSGDGLSRQPFGVQTSAPGEPAFSGSMGMTIEPDFPYYLRIWRPNNDNVYTKLWYEGWDEPADWQAYSGSNPPYGYVPLWVDEQWVEVPPDEPDGDPSWILIPGYWSQELVEWPGGKPSDTTLTNQTIQISAQIFPMTQYSLLIDGIYACTETSDTEPIPYVKPSLPTGSSYSQQFGMVSPEAGMHTIVPYIPKSLILHVNGTMQRKGIDYVEADPSKGTFTLLFTPDEGDKIIVRYLVS